MALSANLKRTSLLLLTALALLTAGRADPVPAAPAGDGPDLDSLVKVLDIQLRALADSTEMTPAAREARIASTTRMTVVRATYGVTETPAILAAASRIVADAIQAVPDYREPILQAVSLAPVVARIEGGAQEIRDSVARGAPYNTPAAETPPSGNIPATRPAVRRRAAGDSVRPTGRQAAREEPRPNQNQSAGAEDVPYALDPVLRFPRGENARFGLTAEVGVEHDDNIFLGDTNQVADTIISVTPGLGFQFGRSTLAGGSFAYQQSLVYYANHSAPRTSLGAGGAQFAYDNGRTSIAMAISYRQINQNNRDTAALGERIFQRNLLDASLVGELGVGSKTRLRTGVALGSMSYRSQELIGTRQVEVPLKFYFPLTPRTSLSAGTSYRHVQPRGDDAGPSSRDFFHQLGIRRAVAPKLSGEISVGYRTREVGDQAGENLWGFDGSLNLETTVRSNLAFVFARDFSTGAQGESLQHDRYTLRFMANPTDQWSLGSAFSFFTADYGPASFTKSNVPVAVFRSDRYLEGSVLTSYSFTRWFSANADYSLRSNDSSLPTAEFSNRVLKLNLRFRY